MARTAGPTAGRAGFVGWRRLCGKHTDILAIYDFSHIYFAYQYVQNANFPPGKFWPCALRGGWRIGGSGKTRQRRRHWLGLEQWIRAEAAVEQTKGGGMMLRLSYRKGDW